MQSRGRDGAEVWHIQDMDINKRFASRRNPSLAETSPSNSAPFWDLTASQCLARAVPILSALQGAGSNHSLSSLLAQVSTLNPHRFRFS